MFRQVALCVFALGTVVGQAVVALGLPLAYEGGRGPFAGGASTAALFILSLVANLDKAGRPKPRPQQPAVS